MQTRRPIIAGSASYATVEDPLPEVRCNAPGGVQRGRRPLCPGVSPSQDNLSWAGGWEGITHPIALRSRAEAQRAVH